jgi:hypothetical protein
MPLFTTGALNPYLTLFCTLKLSQYGTGDLVFSSPLVLPNANIMVGRSTQVNEGHVL